MRKDLKSKDKHLQSEPVDAPSPEPKRTVGGKPFQSKLEPFFDLIRAERQARKTWAEVAQAITEKGTPCSPQGVHAFFKAKQKRRYALGMAPDPLPPATGTNLPVQASATPAPEPQPALTINPLTQKRKTSPYKSL